MRRWLVVAVAFGLASAACVAGPQKAAAAAPASTPGCSGTPAGAGQPAPPIADLPAKIRSLHRLDVSADPRKYITDIPPLLAAAQGNRAISRVDLARARQTLGGAYFNDHQPARALDCIDAAIADMRGAGTYDRAEHAGMLGDRASTLMVLGRVEEGLAASREVLELQRAIKGEHSAEYANALFNVASGVLAQGKLKEAESLVAQVVRITRDAPDRQNENLASYWLSWSNLLMQLGDIGHALQEGRNAADWAERTLGEGHAVTGLTHVVLGKALTTAGRDAEAERHLRRALEIQVGRLGETDFNTAIVLGQLAANLLLRGKPEEAASLLDRAIAIARTHPAPPQPSLLGDLLLNAAQVARAMGDEAGANRRVAEAYEVQKRLGPKLAGLGLASAAHESGLVLLQQGDAAAALARLDEALAISAASSNPNARGLLAQKVAHGIARDRLGDPGGYEEAAQAVAEMRGKLMNDVTSDYEVIRMGRLYAGDFSRFAQFAADKGRTGPAFEAMQLAMLGDLDLAGASHASRGAGAAQAAPIVRQLQDTIAEGARLRAERSAALAAGEMPRVAEVDRRLAIVDAAIARLDREVELVAPGYRSLVRPEPQSLASVQARLDKDEALLLAMPTQGGLLSLLVTRDQVAHAATPLPAGRLSGWVGRLRASVDEALFADTATGDFDVGAASALHAALLPPALDRLASRHRQLTVVGGGRLASVPMGALVTRRVPDDARVAGDALRQQPWLIRRQAVSTPASLRLLGQAGPLLANHAPRFAGIGAPTLAKADSQLAMNERVSRVLRSGSIDAASLRSLPELPDAGAELARMRAAFGAGALLVTGNDATEANVRALDLTPYDVIAFATHGLVSGELRGVSEPGLVLTPAAADPADDGLLTASDVAELRLNADWVILSACNTAAGENAGAPLYSGLARAFVHAGARALLLSHWQVRDDVASRLSVETVQANRNGASRAEALRRAQLRLIDDRSVAGGAHPALWAPFALVGN